MRYTAALAGELRDSDVTGAGRDAYGATTGAHDGLTVAVACALPYVAAHGAEAYFQHSIRIV